MAAVMKPEGATDSVGGTVDRSRSFASMTHSRIGTGQKVEAQWYLGPLAVALAILLAGSAVVAAFTPADGFRFTAAALLGFLPMAVVVARRAPLHLRHSRFGAANWTTLLRSVLTALAAGVIAAPEVLAGKTLGWLPSLLVILGMLLDLLDGRLARIRHETSEFGARFDLEVDAWTTLVLTGVVVALEVAPIWVLAIGLLHYLYRAAALVLPALSTPLPPSLRRRMIGGSQSIALAALLAPSLPSEAAPAVAGIALSALLMSFAIDLRWLLRTPETVD